MSIAKRLFRTQMNKLSEELKQHHEVKTPVIYINLLILFIYLYKPSNIVLEDFTGHSSDVTINLLIYLFYLFIYTSHQTLYWMILQDILVILQLMY